MNTIYENDNFSALAENLYGQVVLHLNIKKWSKTTLEQIRFCFNDFIKECDKKGIELVFAILPSSKTKTIERILPPDQKISLPQPNGQEYVMFAWSTDTWA